MVEHTPKILASEEKATTTADRTVVFRKIYVYRTRPMSQFLRDPSCSSARYITTISPVFQCLPLMGTLLLR